MGGVHWCSILMSVSCGLDLLSHGDHSIHELSPRKRRNRKMPPDASAGMVAEAPTRTSIPRYVPS